MGSRNTSTITMSDQDHHHHVGPRPPSPCQTTTTTITIATFLSRSVQLLRPPQLSRPRSPLTPPPPLPSPGRRSCQSLVAPSTCMLDGQAGSFLWFGLRLGCIFSLLPAWWRRAVRRRRPTRRRQVCLRRSSRRAWLRSSWRQPQLGWLSEWRLVRWRWRLAVYWRGGQTGGRRRRCSRGRRHRLRACLR